MMTNYKYLIIGGGMTANAGVKGIRQVDKEGSIGLISTEPHPPYNRPPLSKDLWKGKSPEMVWLKNAVQGATLHLECRVRTIDPENKFASDDRGEIYHYEKLLLATGGTPRRLESDSDSVLYYRTLDDYYYLRLLTQERRRFAVIGGGFIGSELAAALAINGKEVVMLFPDEGIGGRMFPPDLAGFLNDFYRQKGIEVRSGEKATEVANRENKFILKIRGVQDGREEELEADAVVAGLGIRPNIELAEHAGLSVGNGICVDSALRTSHPDVYAAGDAAEFFNPALGMRLRVEHEDNAYTMGEAAGRSMAGQAVTYDHLPFFYSDMFELGYEAVGEVDSRLETLADWKEPFREGVVYYLRDDRVRGVLLWNVWGQIQAARQLIAEAGPFRPEDLKGRLLEAHQYV
jgi:3-phenylpropionate/trans-cinnamate dioxygenase ferredoxin reductase component